MHVCTHVYVCVCERLGDPDLVYSCIFLRASYNRFGWWSHCVGSRLDIFRRLLHHIRGHLMSDHPTPVYTKFDLNAVSACVLVLSTERFQKQWHLSAVHPHPQVLVSKIVSPNKRSQSYLEKWSKSGAGWSWKILFISEWGSAWQVLGMCEKDTWGWRETRPFDHQKVRVMINYTMLIN